MSITLDLRTVFLADGLISTCVAVCMLLIALTRTTYEGFKQWTAAVFVLNAGLILIGMRGIWPRLLTIIAGNGAVLAAILLVYDGLSLFVGRHPRRLLYLIPLSAWGIPYVYFTYVRPSVFARTEVILVTSLACAAAIVVLYRGRVHKRYGATWILPTGIAVQVTLSLLRLAYTVLYGTNESGLMTSGSVQALFIMATFAAALFTGVGLIVLNSQRTEQELKAATAEVKTLRGIIPICASCKRVRDDKGYWNAVEAYVHDHTGAEFSHSLCPDCVRRLFPDVELDDQ